MSTLKNFIKENFVLVIGMTLPVMLIVLFFVASVIPKSMGTPPQYEMLFSISRFDYQNRLPNNVDFVVKDGVLKVRITKNDIKDNNLKFKKLMAYDGKTDSVKEISFDISKIGDVADGTEIILDETKNMTIDPSNKAPDGYAFDGPSYGSGGLATELFSGGYRNQGYRVKKGSVGYKLPNTSRDYYYDNVQFIGWVVAKK